MKSFIFIVAFVLIGCSSGINTESSEKVIIYEMKSFQEVHEESKIERTDEQVIDQFIRAFHSAEKQAGIVDMVDPDYRVDFDEESYFLWIDDSFGTVMDTDDTHTIYELTSQSAERLKGVLTEQFSAD
ncbi:hypothetical protein CR194_04915 [Salipaludibacillus keqinensis]|uniref:YhfM-like domain-containing protein n=1 Tax=Salipaludibacillus keqinensis TaxID=2045207 RepID=A0A323TJF1_9BACI|nr:hypothetical protein [Salipaludibacillus keqinensis]PYZ94869.1 hypothetical protein CR194_04915 [Salipaludibacillus keqinensis]